MATVAQMVGVRGVDGGHHGIRDVPCVGNTRKLLLDPNLVYIILTD